MSTVETLLESAARCYRLARLDQDACRVFLRLSEFDQAARLYAGLGQWLLAADCFARAGQWEQAADAYEQGGNQVAAAEAWLRAGKRIRAAWLFVAEAGQPHRARALLEDHRFRDPGRILGTAVVLACCDAHTHDPGGAGRHLRRVLVRFDTLGFGDATWIVPRACTVAEQIGRIDLVVLFLAAAWRAGHPGAADRWRDEVARLLGDTAGVPDEDVNTTVPPQGDRDDQDQGPATA